MALHRQMGGSIRCSISHSSEININRPLCMLTHLSLPIHDVYFLDPDQ